MKFAIFLISMISFAGISKAEEFLFLCEINWTNGKLAEARCMKELFGKDAQITEGTLRAMHSSQRSSMQSRVGNGKCETNTNRTRMSLDVRTTCKTKVQIIEFASIWPLDERTKQYFRSSMPDLIERKALEFFKRTHFSSTNNKPMFDWSR